MARIYVVTEPDTRSEDDRVRAAFNSKEDAEKYAALIDHYDGKVHATELHGEFPDVVTCLRMSAQVKPSGDVTAQTTEEVIADGESPVLDASTNLRFESKDGHYSYLFGGAADHSKPYMYVAVKGTDHVRVREEFAARVAEAQASPLRVTVDVCSS